MAEKKHWYDFLSDYMTSKGVAGEPEDTPTPVPTPEATPVPTPGSDIHSLYEKLYPKETPEPKKVSMMNLGDGIDLPSVSLSKKDKSPIRLKRKSDSYQA